MSNNYSRFLPFTSKVIPLPRSIHVGENPSTVRRPSPTFTLPLLLCLINGLEKMSSDVYPFNIFLILFIYTDLKCESREEDGVSLFDKITRNHLSRKGIKGV